MGAVLLRRQRNGIRGGSGCRGRTRRGTRSSVDPAARSRAACRTLASELHSPESEPTMKLMAVVIAASMAGAFAPDRAWSAEPLERYALIVLSLIHISEPTRILSISYAVFCLKKKKN